MTWNAYIDESGDRGWSFSNAASVPGVHVGSSRCFSMSAVLVPAGTENLALSTWDAAARVIRRPVGTTVHWINLRSHSERRYMVDALVGIPNLTTITVTLCKRHLPNVTLIKDPTSLYNWTFRLMIERLSWFGYEIGEPVNATFAQVGGLSPAVIQAYVGLLQWRSTYIRWSHLRSPIGIDNPSKRRMLQLSDTVSGAVFAAFEPDRFGYTNQTYLEALKPRIWRRRGRELHKDGLKFGPWPSADCGAEHPWLAAFCA